MDGTIGLIGCGAMGSGIGQNLLRKQYDVMVYDIDSTNTDSLEKRGAKKAESLSQLSQKCKYILTSLPNSQILKEVLVGEEGIFQHIKQDSFVLDFSTIDPETAQQMYEEARKRNSHFLDCPVSGGPKGALDGTLTVMIGGEEKSFQTIKPLLEAIGKHIYYLGRSGSGQVMKLCNNLMVGGIIALISEAFMTGVKAGISPQKMAMIMQQSTAQNRVFDVFGENILTGHHEEVKFLLSHMSKDLRLYIKLANECQTSLFVGSVVQQLFQMAEQQGKGKLDSSGVAELLEEWFNQSISMKCSEN